MYSLQEEALEGINIECPMVISTGPKVGESAQNPALLTFFCTSVRALRLLNPITDMKRFLTLSLVCFYCFVSSLSAQSELDRIDPGTRPGSAHPLGHRGP